MEPEALITVDATPTSTQIADAAATQALTAATELIIATLRESVPTRFAEAQKLCGVVQELTRARGRRAADFHGDPQPHVPMQGGGGGGVIYANNIIGNAGNGMVVGINNVAQGAVQMANYNVAAENPPQYVDDANGRRVPVGQPRVPGRILFDDHGNLVNEEGIIYAGNIDANALMRHMLMAFGPHAQTGAEANRARVAADEAAELKSLTVVLESPLYATFEPAEKATLTGRIKQLMANMERRSNANAKPAEEVPVVPADDQRGHPADAGGPEDDASPRLRADGDGDAGHGGPPPARPLYQVGEVAVV